jgi:nitrate/nitrite transporter NarK
MMPKQLRVLFFFTLAYFLSYFYRSANAVIAPDLTREIGLSASELGLMTSLFFASFALVQLPLGYALDSWGPRWVTPGLMFLAVTGSLLFSSGTSLPSLALGRVLIGIGMAGILMGALKAFSQWFPPNRYATASSLLIGIGSLGALAASTPLAFLNQSLGWRSVFGMGAGVIALAALAIVLWVRNAPEGVEWRSRTGIASEGSVFSSMHFWRISPLVFFCNGTLLAFQGLWAGPYLFDVFSLDQVRGGNVLLLLSLGVTLGYLVSGWIADRWGLARVVVLGSTVFILGLVVLALRPSLVVVGIVYFLLGVFGGFGIMLVAQPRQLFALHLLGRALTAVTIFAIGGTFIIQWVMGLIINTYTPDVLGHYPPQAHSTALAFTASGMFLALIWYLPMLKREVSDEG